jgi:hypothetical protein
MPRPSYERDDESGDIDEMDHYEADREIRTKGVGFYHFSKDEESRADQLAKLNKLRQETEQARQSATSASDKRKAMLAKNADKIKARRAALQAKKHQLKPEEVPKDINVDQVNEDSVNMFLQSIRSKFE